MDKPSTHDAPGDNNEVDPFVHAVAIKLSRALNSINPNDLLARRVIDIVKSNSPDGFLKGASTLRLEEVLNLSTFATDKRYHTAWQPRERLGSSRTHS